MDVSPEVLATVQRHLRHVVERIDDTFYARARSQATAAIRTLPQVDFLVYAQDPWSEAGGAMRTRIVSVLGGVTLNTADDSAVTLTATLPDGTPLGVALFDLADAPLEGIVLSDGAWVGKILVVGVPSSHEGFPPRVNLRVDCADGRVGTGTSVQWIVP